jgi:hypothetical protein
VVGQTLHHWSPPVLARREPCRAGFAAEPNSNRPHPRLEPQRPGATLGSLPSVPEGGRGLGPSYSGNYHQSDTRPSSPSPLPPFPTKQTEPPEGFSWGGQGKSAQSDPHPAPRRKLVGVAAAAAESSLQLPEQRGAASVLAAVPHAAACGPPTPRGARGGPSTDPPRPGTEASPQGAPSRPLCVVCGVWFVVCSVWCVVCSV